MYVVTCKCILIICRYIQIFLFFSSVGLAEFFILFLLFLLFFSRKFMLQIGEINVNIYTQTRHHKRGGSVRVRLT